jgi:hypothetical protein
LQPQTGQGCSRSRPKPSCPSLLQTSTRLQGRVDWSGYMQINVWRGGGWTDFGTTLCVCGEVTLHDCVCMPSSGTRISYV